MPPVYQASTINNRLTDVLNAIGGGANLLILDGSNNALSTLAMPTGTPGSVAGGVLTFGGMPWVDPAAVLGGVPVAAKIVDSGSNNVVTGLTVGTLPGTYDIVLSSPTITAGQTIEITAAAITGR